MLSVQPPVIPQRARIPLHADDEKATVNHIELSEVMSPLVAL